MVDPVPWNEHELIFVGGLHRSGTTLLADAIASAQDASGLTDTNVRMDEGQFLQDVYPIGAVFGGPSRWALDPRSHLVERDAAAVPDAARRLWAGWSPYWRAEARYLVEKTPLNLTKTRFLQAIFPSSKFVVVTRHPITQSQAVRKWSTSTWGKYGLGFPKLIENWVRAHEVFQRDARRLQHIHVIRYEAMMTDPAPQVARLSNFLGFEVPVDHFAASDPVRFRAYGTSWDDSVSGGGLIGAVRTLIGPSDVDRRKAVVEQLVLPHYAKVVRRNFGARVEALGYDLGDYYAADAWSASTA